MERRKRTKTNDVEVENDNSKWLYCDQDPEFLEARFVSYEIGMGVFATSDIEEGSFLMEYVGELISHSEGNHREKMSPSCYRYFFAFKGKRFCVDAAAPEPPRLGRLVNHGNTRKVRNASMRILTRNSLPVLCLFATRKIKPNEEILYDYGIKVPWLKNYIHNRNGEIRRQKMVPRSKVKNLPKRSLSAFNVFSRRILANAMFGQTIRTRMKEAGKQWKQVDESEKTAWQNVADENETSRPSILTLTERQRKKFIRDQFDQINKITKKKKYFVLREESSASGPARLEYYDSEKKFKSGLPAKRCIVLKNCFSINPKSDSKHQFAVVLYTKDDCFGVVFESDAVRQDWLSELVTLRSQSIEESTLTTKPLFEHVWPVTVRSKGLASREKSIPPGPYRLCLTNRDISLIRLNKDEPDITVPLDVVRRCGHSHDFFFLELGRSAVTGPGELWLQVEDTVISQNMHEAILNAMKNNTALIGIQPYRPRTTSNASGSGTRKHSRSGPSRSNTISVHPKENKPSPVAHRASTYTTTLSIGSAPGPVSRLDSSERHSTTSSFDDPDMGYPSSSSTRSITPEECILEEVPESSEYFPMNPQLALDSGLSVEDNSTYFEFKPQFAASAAVSAEALESDYMPMPGSSKPTTGSRTGPSEGVRFSSRESETFSGQSSDYEKMSAVLSSAAGTVSQQSAASNYMQMAAPTTLSSTSTSTKAIPDVSAKKISDTASVFVATVKKASSSASKAGSDYVSMKTPTDEGYMDMKAGSQRSSDEPAHGSGSSVSSVVSLTSGTVSSAVSSRSSAVEPPNIAAFHSLSRLQELSSEGYIEMSPQNTMSSHNNALRMHLDIVPSFLHDAENGHATGGDATGGAADVPPKRAYSVGSKPRPPSKPICSGSYIDMSGTVAAAVVTDLDEVEKSCSAPHLNEETHGALQRPLSGAAAAEVTDRFMELDFHPRTDGAGTDYRARASSGGARDFSSRMLSHNAKDALARITFFRRGGATQYDAARRPRTSTICQESLRPRTSSFGTTGDARPRSSSGGNARLRDVFGPDTLLGARRLGTQRSTSKRSSVESSADSLIVGADYLNMTCGSAAVRGPVVQPCAIAQSDQYMVMRPGEMAPTSTSPSIASSDYLEMGRTRAPVQVSLEPPATTSSPQSTLTEATAEKHGSTTDAPQLTAETSPNEPSVPPPFELGISFQSLHYTAPSSSEGNNPVMQNARSGTVVEDPVVPASTDTMTRQLDISYASLDLQSAGTPRAEPLRTAAVHEYAQIDFNKSDKK